MYRRIIVFITLLLLCGVSYGQRVVGNPGVFTTDLGGWSFTEYLQAPATLDIKPNRNYCHTIAIVHDSLFIYSCNLNKWILIVSPDSTIYTTLYRNSLKLNSADTAGKWLGAGFAESDPYFNLNGVKKADSLIFYITPKNLKDSLHNLRASLPSGSSDSTIFATNFRVDTGKKRKQDTLSGVGLVKQNGRTTSYRYDWFTTSGGGYPLGCIPMSNGVTLESLPAGIRYDVFNQTLFVSTPTSPTVYGSLLSIVTGGGIGFSNGTFVSTNIWGSGDKNLSMSSATGKDIDFQINGTKKVSVLANGDLSLAGSVSGSLGIRANPTTTPHTYVMPPSQGASATVLTNDGSGGLTWAPVASSFSPTTTITGDATGVGVNTVTVTLASVGIAGTAGSATQCPVIVFDTKGRETGWSNVTITPDWPNITNRPTTVEAYSITNVYNKTASDARYLQTAVTSVTAGTGLNGGAITGTGTISMPNVGTAGTYGSSSLIPVITTDAQGRVSGVTTTTITPTGVTSITAGSGLSGGTITGTGTISLPTYGTAGTYGSSSLMTIVTTNAFGQCSVTTTPVAAVTSVIAGTGLSGGTITSTGTISMPNVGTGGTYGSSTAIPVITTDVQGRVSSVTTATFTSGGVTSVAVAAPPGFTVSGSPVTGSGTITIGYAGIFTISDAANFVFDGSNGFVQKITLGAARTFTVTNILVGPPYTFYVTHGTSTTLTWGTTVKSDYGTTGAPPQSTANGDVDTYTIRSDGTNIRIGWSLKSN